MGWPCAAWPADPIRTYPHATGTVGRLDADCRAAGSRLSRRRPASHSTGGPSRPCGLAELNSPPSLTRPASHRPATTSWTAGYRLTNPTAFRRPPRPRCRRLRARGGRVVAIGTTVVRALEHAATAHHLVTAGAALATQRIGRTTILQVVDAVFSGIHEPGTSHYEMLRAFSSDETLSRANDELVAHNYLTHEFGDSVLIERAKETKPCLIDRARRKPFTTTPSLANVVTKEKELQLHSVGSTIRSSTRHPS